MKPLTCFPLAVPSPVAPSRGRGLKPGKNSPLPWSWSGRPFTGAWIETPSSRNTRRATAVAPSRGRGLKLIRRMYRRALLAVAPSRGRGLKHLRAMLRSVGLGRPFTGAWIETLICPASAAASTRRPFTGAWIETPGPAGAPAPRRRSPLHGGVD